MGWELSQALGEGGGGSWSVQCTVFGDVNFFMAWDGSSHRHCEGCWPVQCTVLGGVNFLRHGIGAPTGIVRVAGHYSALCWEV